MTTKGYYSRERGSGGLTRFIPTDRLLERFEGLEGHPAFVMSPEEDLETIILRDQIDNNNVDIDYKDTPRTERYRDNLKEINTRLLNHWADSRIKDTEVQKLAERILQDENKDPIDLSRRTLVRILQGLHLEKEEGSSRLVFDQ